MDLNDLAGAFRRSFDAKTAARERGLEESRKAVRSSGLAIRALHRHEVDAAAELLGAAQSELDRARGVVRDHPEILYAGFIHDAEKELAEARITFAFVTDADLPSPDDIGVPPSAYLKGMAESIGELRRHILDLLRRGELERCESLLATWTRCTTCW